MIQNLSPQGSSCSTNISQGYFTPKTINSCPSIHSQQFYKISKPTPESFKGHSKSFFQKNGAFLVSDVQVEKDKFTDQKSLKNSDQQKTDDYQKTKIMKNPLKLKSLHNSHSQQNNEQIDNSLEEEQRKHQKHNLLSKEQNYQFPNKHIPSQRLHQILVEKEYFNQAPKMKVKLYKNGLAIAQNNNNFSESFILSTSENDKTNFSKSIIEIQSQPVILEEQQQMQPPQQQSEQQIPKEEEDAISKKALLKAKKQEIMRKKREERDKFLDSFPIKKDMWQKVIDAHENGTFYRIPNFGFNKLELFKHKDISQEKRNKENQKRRLKEGIFNHNINPHPQIDFSEIYSRIRQQYLFTKVHQKINESENVHSHFLNASVNHARQVWGPNFLQNQCEDNKNDESSIAAETSFLKSMLSTDTFERQQSHSLLSNKVSKPKYMESQKSVKSIYTSKTSLKLISEQEKRFSSSSLIHDLSEFSNLQPINFNQMPKGQVQNSEFKNSRIQAKMY